MPTQRKANGTKAKRRQCAQRVLCREGRNHVQNASVIQKNTPIVPLKGGHRKTTWPEVISKVKRKEGDCRIFGFCAKMEGEQEGGENWGGGVFLVSEPD